MPALLSLFTKPTGEFEVCAGIHQAPAPAPGELNTPQFRLMDLPLRPSGKMLVLSAVIHAVAISFLASVQIAIPIRSQPRSRVQDDFQPLQIKLGGKIYYVTSLPKPIPLAGKSAPALRSQPRQVQAPGPEELARQDLEKVARQSPRPFIAPPIRKQAANREIIIELLPSPNVDPKLLARLPDVVIWTPAPTRPRREFIAPGNPIRQPEPQAKMLAPEDITLAPQPMAMRQAPKLTIPNALPPAEIPADTTHIGRSDAGDALRAIIISHNAVPIQETLTLPLAPPSSARQAGQDAGGVGIGPDPKNLSAGSIRAGGAVTGAAGGAAAGANTITAGVATGNEFVISLVPVAPPVVTRITRPPDGHFDAVVVQSSSLDMFPESKGTLGGRPIYTVYLPVGTRKEWILMFCRDIAKSAEGWQPRQETTANVISLGAGAPITAPYPTVMIRPQIALPAGNKYMLVFGRVTATGRAKDLRIIRNGKPETDESLLSSLAQWEFRPAKEDGQPVMIQFLLAIPADAI